MLRFLQVLALVALLISTDARPKKFSGISTRIPKRTKSEDDTGRLPMGEVWPQNYKLDLVLTKEGLEKNNIFTGTVDISINIKKNVTSFKLHSKKLTLSDEVSFTYNNSDIFDGKITKNEPDEHDVITISSDKIITKGDYILSLTFTGELSVTDMEGFYKSTYKDDSGKMKYLATTQFEQQGARRVFPCFDDPGFKATFDISISYPEGYNAMSNAKPIGKPIDKDGLKKVTFKTTPAMSTYIIAFVVSEFVCQSGSPDADNIPTEVCARFGNETMTTALETAPKALNAMSEYTSHKYKDLSNLAKFTEVAIPDFAAGAMENWGLLTFREGDLLWDKDESSNYYKQVVTTVTTHEISHQWFGDYISLDWWSNTFLNEGFATYFQYHTADKFSEGWELTKQFVVEQIQQVLVTDSSINSLPLSYNVTTPEEIENRFDDISYNKGGTLLRMVEHFLGSENFRTGLSEYLNKQPVGSVSALWSSFKDVGGTQKLPAEVETIMENWTLKPGYPLLSVTAETSGTNTTITISQERFLLSDEKDDTKWYVPITYAVAEADFTDTTTKVWLKPEDKSTTVTIKESPQWFILNNQQVGYYRIDYKGALLDKISKALSEDLTKIDEISRSQIVDDQLNLARAGKKKYNEVLKFLTFLKKDTSYYSWYSAFKGFDYMLRHTSSKAVRDALKAYIIEQMDALLKNVPITDEDYSNQIKTLKQVLALQWACDLDEATCIQETKTRFENYTKGTKINPNLRSVVYCNGLRQSQKGLEDFKFLYDKYTASQLATEQVTILKALGCVNDAKVRKTYLEKIFTDEVRIQDVKYVFESVYLNNPDGVNNVISFLKDNYKNFTEHFGSNSNWLSQVNNVAGYITTNDQITALKELTNIKDLTDSDKEEINSAAENANKNLKTIKKLEEELKDYFGLSDNGAPINSYYIINLALVIGIFLIFN